MLCIVRVTALLITGCGLTIILGIKKIMGICRSNLNVHILACSTVKLSMLNDKSTVYACRSLQSKFDICPSSGAQDKPLIYGSALKILKLPIGRCYFSGYEDLSCFKK